MSNEVEAKKEAAATIVKAAEENPTIDLSSLVPLGNKWLESMERQTESQLKMAETRIEAEKWAFKHRFWLLTGIVLGVFLISFGLIFVKNDANSGLLVLSHVGAVVAGLIAGSGWEKIKSSRG